VSGCALLKFLDTPLSNAKAVRSKSRQQLMPLNNLASDYNVALKNLSEALKIADRRNLFSTQKLLALDDEIWERKYFPHSQSFSKLVSSFV